MHETSRSVLNLGAITFARYDDWRAEKMYS